MPTRKTAFESTSCSIGATTTPSASRAAFCFSQSAADHSSRPEVKQCQKNQALCAPRYGRSIVSQAIKCGFGAHWFDCVTCTNRDCAGVEEAEEDVRARIAQLLSSCQSRDSVNLKYTGASLSLDKAYAIFQSHSRRCTVTGLVLTCQPKKLNSFR